MNPRQPVPGVGGGTPQMRSVPRSGPAKIAVTGVGSPIPADQRPENIASTLINSVYQDEVGRMLMNPTVLKDLPQWGAYLVTQNRALTMEVQCLVSLLIARGLITQVELDRFHAKINEAMNAHFEQMVAQLGRSFAPQPPPADPSDPRSGT
jgi:hypothetical protein